MKESNFPKTFLKLRIPPLPSPLFSDFNLSARQYVLCSFYMQQGEMDNEFEKSEEDSVISPRNSSSPL